MGNSATKTNILIQKDINGTEHMFEICRDRDGTYYANVWIGKERFFIPECRYGYSTKKKLIDNIISSCD